MVSVDISPDCSNELRDVLEKYNSEVDKYNKSIDETNK